MERPAPPRSRRGPHNGSVAATQTKDGVFVLQGEEDDLAAIVRELKEGADKE